MLDDNNQASPITAEQVSGGLGAQGTTVLDRVPDPSPILQDQPGILVTAKSTLDTTLASKMIEFGDIFTFNTARSLLFAQDLWGPSLTALAEGKPPPEPPPDSKGHVHVQMSPSKGAAYFVRQTIAITTQLWDDHATYVHLNLLFGGHDAPDHQKLKDGCMDTSEEEDVWDEAAYYAHLDHLDFG